MKDTLITACRKKTELITLLVCFLLANLLNLYSIITYKTPAIEMLTSMGYVLVASVFLYVVWSVLRLLFYAIRYLLKKRKTT